MRCCCCRAVWLLLLHAAAELCCVLCCHNMSQPENEMPRNFVPNNIVAIIWQWKLLGFLFFPLRWRATCFLGFPRKGNIFDVPEEGALLAVFLFLCYSCVTASSCVVQHYFRPRLSTALNAHTTPMPVAAGSVHGTTVVAVVVCYDISSCGTCRNGFVFFSST